MSDECSNCRFWRRRTDHAGEMGGGYCRRFPPSFPSGLTVRRPLRDSSIADITNSDGYLNDAWPNTHQQSWCGEYQRHPQQRGEEP